MALILDGTTGVPVTTVTGTLPVANGGSGVTTSTGTGANVLGTSPTLVTPTFDSAQLPTISGTAPLYMCRAWVNFDGTLASPITPRAGGNVTNITKNSTGNYTLNFTTAMPDANYVVTASSTLDLAATADTVTVGVVAGNETLAPNLKTTTQVTIGTSVSGGLPATDCAEIYIAIFR